MKAKFVYTDKSYIYLEYPLPPQGLSKQIKKLFCLPCTVEFQGSEEEVNNKQNLNTWKTKCKERIRET